MRMAAYVNALAKNGRLISRCFSRVVNSRGIHDEPVYELRTYSIYPKDFKAFIQLSAEHLHLRTKHSKLIGYWTSEIGGINDVVHIWEYDCLKHRADVRQALGNDPDWLAQYIKKILPMLDRQDNALLKLTRKSSLVQTDSGGVYELCCTEKPLKDLPVTRGDAQLLGTFSSLIGSLSSSYQLWHHKSVDDIVTSAAEGSYKPYCTKSRLLLPTAWSPMK
ncbi:protein NipSnap homolog 3A-like [Saccostrea echinata]|uniref:protein NipSnap homolog 3A-like n=1 Tax=Saccostrea echinata TaxID=191078 RepID=UPI002A804924|nr:protein NipSnap homolog 3A-like [Saccostrea echinata]